MRPAPTRQITLRLPEALYYTVKRVAKQRRTSINRLAHEELAARMREAYDALSTDAEENDVEGFLAAEREVVIRNPA